MNKIINQSTYTKIAFILPYFGKFNNYFHLFLESCKNNPTVDWLIYTDCEENYPYPENVKVHPCTFEEFKNRIQKNFDFIISLHTPYKLCDFRPAYGEVLQDDLAGYDFWGHCDCDLVFGNIRNFFTEKILSRYDRVYNNGHLVLYRNTPEINAYYRVQKHINYKSILQSDRSFTFDEWPGISECWRRDKKDCFNKSYFDDIISGENTFRITKEVPGGFIGPYHNQADQSLKFSRMKNIVYRYEKGSLMRYWTQKDTLYNEEVLYVHLQKRPMTVVDDLTDPSNYLIIPNSFIPTQTLTVDILKKLAPAVKRNQRTQIKKIIHIVLAEIRNIGKTGYCSKSVLINLTKTHLLKTYDRDS